MNGIKADIFKIKASKTEIKSANKYKNATTFTAIRYIYIKKRSLYLRNLLIFYIFLVLSNRNLRFFYKGFFLVINLETTMGFPFLFFFVSYLSV